MNPPCPVLPLKCKASAMETDRSTVRQRNPADASSRRTSPPRRRAPSPPNDTAITTASSVVDVLRLIFLVVLLNSLLSYFVTQDSLIWNAKPPRLARPAVFRAWLRGPLHLTPAELVLYNGSDPELPIYLAVNGTVFDVSAGRHYYGPGGGYSFFAGRDGARAFVTGCFGEEWVIPDLRGAEEAFLETGRVGVVSPEVSLCYAVGCKHLLMFCCFALLLLNHLRMVESGKGLATCLGWFLLTIDESQERKAAIRTVRESVRHWENFFKNSNKYFEVGKVKYEPGWLEKMPRKGLCEQAERSRPKPDDGGK